MSISEGPPQRWQDAVHARMPKWGTTQPLTPSELRPVLYAKDGRSIQEDRTKRNPAGVPFVDRVLTFPERKGLKGNHSSYVGISEEFDNILAMVSHIRSVVHPYERRLTFDGVSNVVNTLTNLSTFLVLRADNPIRNGEIPTEIAAVTKNSPRVFKTSGYRVFKVG